MDTAAPATAAAKTREANCFDFLRLFAASCVVVSHSTEHLKLPFFWLQQNNGHSYWFYDGVALFFVLSGFLVYHSYERSVQRGRPLRQYLLNRFLRIAPGLYAYVIITSILLLVIGALHFSEMLSKGYLAWVFSHIVLFPIHAHVLGRFAPEGINGSLWTIPAEFSFYLFIPIIYWVQQKLGTRKMLVLLGLTGLCSIMLTSALTTAGALHDQSGNPLSPHPVVYRAAQLIRLTFVPYLTFFGLGIFWSKYWKSIPKHGWMALACLDIYLLIRTFNLIQIEPESGLALFPRDSLNPLYCVAWALPLSYAVLWIGHYGPSLLVRIPQKIGDLSYGVYIWHMILVNLVIYTGLKGTLADVHIGSVYFGPQLFVIGGTLVMAALSWNLIEKPALRLKPYSSRTAGTAPAGAESQGAETAQTLAEAPEELSMNPLESGARGDGALQPSAEGAK